MKSKQEIERNVEETLNSLDGLQPAEAGEFLYTRIAGKLQHVRDNEVSRGSKLLLRISLAMLLLCVINIGAFMLLKDKPTVKKTNGIDAFASQYGLKQDSYSY